VERRRRKRLRGKQSRRHLQARRLVSTYLVVVAAAKVVAVVQRAGDAKEHNISIAPLAMVKASSQEGVKVRLPRETSLNGTSVSIAKDSAWSRVLLAARDEALHLSSAVRDES